MTQSGSRPLLGLQQTPCPSQALAGGRRRACPRGYPVESDRASWRGHDGTVPRTGDRRACGDRRVRRRAPAAPARAGGGPWPDRPRAHAGLRLSRPGQHRGGHAGRARYALRDRLDQQVVCGRGAAPGARGRARRPARAGDRLRALVLAALDLCADHAAPPAQPHVGDAHGHRVQRRGALRPVVAARDRARLRARRALPLLQRRLQARRPDARGCDRAPGPRARGRTHRGAARHDRHRDHDQARLTPARGDRLPAALRRPAGARGPAARRGAAHRKLHGRRQHRLFCRRHAGLRPADPEPRRRSRRTSADRRELRALGEQGRRRPRRTRHVLRLRPRHAHARRLRVRRPLRRDASASTACS